MRDTKKDGRKNPAVFESFFKLQHSAGFFRPAVLRHVFTVKLWLSVFKETEVIAFHKVGINTIVRGVMLENIFCVDCFQRVLQIQHELPQVSQVLEIIGIVREQNRADLFCGHS